MAPAPSQLATAAANLTSAIIAASRADNSSSSISEPLSAINSTTDPNNTTATAPDEASPLERQLPSILISYLLIVPFALLMLSNCNENVAVHTRAFKRWPKLKSDWCLMALTHVGIYLASLLWGPALVGGILFCLYKAGEWIFGKLFFHEEGRTCCGVTFGGTRKGNGEEERGGFTGSPEAGEEDGEALLGSSAAGEGSGDTGDSVTEQQTYVVEAGMELPTYSEAVNDKEESR